MARGKYPCLSDVLMEKVASEGKSLAHVEQGTLFVECTVPGDRVDVQITKRKKGYLEGYVVRFTELSPLRQKAACRHFGVCGGCQWQMLPYAFQLQSKQQQVYDQLSRIGDLTLPELQPILPAIDTFFYRNKLEYTFSPRGWMVDRTLPDAGADQPLPMALGFHIPGRYDRILDIDECLLQPEPSNAIRNAVRGFALRQGYTFYDSKTQSGWLRNLMIRTATTGQVMLLLVLRHDEPAARERLLGHIVEAFPDIHSLLWCINPKVNDTIYDLPIHTYRGAERIVEQLGDLLFEVGPKSFFQTNTRQAHRLYEKVRELADPQAHETLYDLYTGTGTIALYMARAAHRVVGVESVPEAIEDAWHNAARNRITNVSFHAGDVLQMLNDDFVAREGKPDVLITDPPRAGMHPKVIETLLRLAPPRMVYVSCNPATQARDLALLSPGYCVTAVQPVDMFPHTKHVENIVQLRHRG